MAEGAVKQARRTELEDEEEIHEFFGGAKKSSKKQFVAVDSDEDEGAEVGGADSEGGEEREEEGAEQGNSRQEGSEIDIELIMAQRR